ncbi:hypothetical protein [Shewanella youngdeokensis]|uniref:Uncharacterized protein n=1 Tax=Shewanella youngdeokensis TaxID=2999068 RepID=A0ABZ0K0U8_9GAMM|nr:hypothetical protein RGE70_05110 [Shewanella sp. DAU334]
MALDDLKKSSTPSNITQRTQHTVHCSPLALERLIDDFINGATDYETGNTRPLFCPTPQVTFKRLTAKTPLRLFSILTN